MELHPLVQQGVEFGLTRQDVAVVRRERDVVVGQRDGSILGEKLVGLLVKLGV
jgi:hypothetical protein